MFGQGSPSSFARALAHLALVLCALLAGSLPAQEVSAPQVNSSTPITPISDSYRLRISWGGGDARRWVGNIRLNRGSLSGLNLFGGNPDASGSLWIENGELRVGDLSPHKQDVVELTADAAQDAQLTVELASCSSLAGRSCSATL
jgi:hypothetical protein